MPIVLKIRKQFHESGVNVQCKLKAAIGGDCRAAARPPPPAAAALSRC